MSDNNKIEVVSQSMSETPELTILMPLYNEEMGIERALQALKSQTYRKFRLVISDNASTDNTVSICQTTISDDHRFSIVQQKENLGGAGNFSFLLSCCETPYFMFAAGHDEWDKNCVLHLMTSITASPQHVLAYPATEIRSVDNELIDESADPPSFENPCPLARACELIRRVTWCNMFYGIFRASAYRECRQDVRCIGPDHVLLMDLAFRGKIIGVPEAKFVRHEPRPLPANDEDHHRSQLSRVYARQVTKREIKLRYWTWMLEHFKSARASASGIRGVWRALRIAGVFYRRFRPRLTDLLEAISKPLQA